MSSPDTKTSSPVQWNTRNPAVKRIVQELRELQRDDNPDVAAEALEVGQELIVFVWCICNGHLVCRARNELWACCVCTRAPLT